MVKALITGITGQDGSYLAELLLSKGYEVHGLIRRTALYPESLKNIEHIKDSIKLHHGDLATENHLSALIAELQPDEVYNLASQSDVRISFDIPEYTGDITGLGVVRLLEAIRKFSPKSKFYQASSSEMFGNSPPPQNEETPMNPRSPYGAAKLYGYNITRVYRDSYNLFCCNGVLFNHESERRGRNFVTRKITKSVPGILNGTQKKLDLGNLDAKRDWGYAPDYCEAMWLMMQQDRPDDFAIGTGKAHSVRDFLDCAFGYVGLDWGEYVEIDPNLFRPTEVNYLLADATKAKSILGWEPKTSFSELVKIMVESDLKEVIYAR
ncbi:MAG: GDP-mannose 4,6-dehydratase [Dehalococcoidia bacterium]|nr:GDP-mannose 4,6-dehydratase [Dehalococcoidia bacterium]